MNWSVLLKVGHPRMSSEQIREAYIRACQLFRNRPAMYAQVKRDLISALDRNEITMTDYKIVDQIHRSFNIIDTKSRVVI